MPSLTFLKMQAALLATLFAASTPMIPANADIIKRDQYGFEARKTCLFDGVIRASYIDGEKTALLAQAKNAEWNMELYVNKITNRWVLLAKSRDPATYPGKTCVLSENHIEPYQNEKWYGLFFENNAKPKK